MPYWELLVAIVFYLTSAYALQFMYTTLICPIKNCKTEQVTIIEKRKTQPRFTTLKFSQINSVFLNKVLSLKSEIRVVDPAPEKSSASRL